MPKDRQLLSLSKVRNVQLNETRNNNNCHLCGSATCQAFCYSTDEETEAQINYLLKVTQPDRKVETDFEPQTVSFQFMALTTPPWLTSLYL